MYNIELLTVISKPTDFKICKQCKGLNWYENEECLHCNDRGMETSSDFNETKEAVNEYLKSEYEFYQEEEGMSESEVDRILVDV